MQVRILENLGRYGDPVREGEDIAYPKGAICDLVDPAVPDEQGDYKVYVPDGSDWWFVNYKFTPVGPHAVYFAPVGNRPLFIAGLQGDIL